MRGAGAPVRKLHLVTASCDRRGGANVTGQGRWVHVCSGVRAWVAPHCAGRCVLCGQSALIAAGLGSEERHPDLRDELD